VKFHSGQGKLLIAYLWAGDVRPAGVPVGAGRQSRLRNKKQAQQITAFIQNIMFFIGYICGHL